MSNIRPEIEKMFEDAFRFFANAYSIELDNVNHDITALKKSHEFLTAAEYDDPKEKYEKLLKSSKQGERFANQPNIKLEEIETNEQDEFHKWTTWNSMGAGLPWSLKIFQSRRTKMLSKLLYI